MLLVSFGRKKRTQEPQRHPILQVCARSFNLRAGKNRFQRMFKKSQWNRRNRRSAFFQQQLQDFSALCDRAKDALRLFLRFHWDFLNILNCSLLPETIER